MNVVYCHETPISFQLVPPQKRYFYSFKHTLTCTFFQQHVFMYIPLQEQTVRVEFVSALCFLRQGEHIANGKLKEK